MEQLFQQNYISVQITRMRKFLITLSFSFIVLFVKAQTGLFVMSSIGAMAGTTSNGLAINFNSIAACIDVQTGVAVLNGARGNGQFAINCEVTMKINSLGIKMYPNPVSSYLWISGEANNIKTILYTLTDAQGKIIMKNSFELSVTNENKLDLSTLNTGVYFLRLENSSGLIGIERIVVTR
jgi:hypothetical protein